MTLMLGLSIALGSVAMFAQNSTDTTKSTAKKKAKKKTKKDTTKTDTKG
jgi:hypothetical protein